MSATNSPIQEYLCQLGLGFINSGASRLNIQRSPLMIVEVLFQTSALLADNWPPLANDVSIAAWLRADKARENVSRRKTISGRGSIDDRFRDRLGLHLMRAVFQPYDACGH